MSKWADDNEDGLHAYVRSETSWGRTTHRLVYAASLADAKARFGWTRQAHTAVNVRRATREDAETIR